MDTLHTFSVLHSERGMRLDLFLATRLQDFGLSREKVKQAIKAGNVYLDGVVSTSPKEGVYADATIVIRLPEVNTSLVPEMGDLPILYRDKHLAIVNKPAGLTVHPCPSCLEGTLAHRLVAHFPELAGLEGARPGIVHRLDKDTSGLVVVALTEKSRLALTEMFAERTIHKEYLTLVQGVPRNATGVIEASIGRHPVVKTKMAVTEGGKFAKTEWRVLYADPQKRFSVLAVTIHTGRTHQIRVHMTHLGHPLWGDAVYTTPPVVNGKRLLAPLAPLPPLRPLCPARQMLHAWKLAFDHPLAQGSEGPLRVDISAPPPQDFTDFLQCLMLPPLRVVITGLPGSGKSALLQSFAARGIAVLSADTVVAALYQQGGAGQYILRARFGNRFVPHPDAPVDKALLGAAMQESVTLRREIENLLHPLVKQALEDFWEQQTALGGGSAAEIPLYLEAGFARVDVEKDNRSASYQSQGASHSRWGVQGTRGASHTELLHHPIIIGVQASSAVRGARLAARGWTAETIANIESWQWAEEEKMGACDYVIENNGTEAELAHAGQCLWEQIESARAGQARELLRGMLEEGEGREALLY